MSSSTMTNAAKPYSASVVGFFAISLASVGCLATLTMAGRVPSVEPPQTLGRGHSSVLP